MTSKSEVEVKVQAKIGWRVDIQSDGLVGINITRGPYTDRYAFTEHEAREMAKAIGEGADVLKARRIANRTFDDLRGVSRNK